MNFAFFYSTSNSSIYDLQGNVIICKAPIQSRNNTTILLDTGLKTHSSAAKAECGQPHTSLHIHGRALRVPSLQESSCLHKRPVEDQRLLEDSFLVAIEQLEWFGEAKLMLPNMLDRTQRATSIWTELLQLWRSRHLVRGFVLNSVKGGYAVAIGGHIAFLPRSLRRSRQVSHGEWRTFSILKMNLKIRNIVVKEVRSSFDSRERARSVAPAGLPSQRVRRQTGATTSWMPQSLLAITRQHMVKRRNCTC